MKLTIFIATIFCIGFMAAPSLAGETLDQLAWAKRAGSSSGDDTGKDMAVLPDGSVLVTGQCRSSAMFGQGDDNQTVLSTGGIFIAKYNPDGTLNWAKRTSGNVNNVGYGISAFSDGSSVVTGSFRFTTTFGPTEGNQTALTAAGGSDIFVAKYNADGTLNWAKRAGAVLGTSEGCDVAALPDGSALVTGVFACSTTFGNASEGLEVTLTADGQEDIFIAKYNADGTLAWVKQAGGPDLDCGYGLFALSDGSAMVTGSFGGPTSTSATFGNSAEGGNQSDLTSSGVHDIFIARYNPDGTLNWAKSAGGSSSDYSYAISAFPDNSAIITGTIFTSATFNGSTTLTSNGGVDVFVAKYDGAGNLQWAKNAGGASIDRGYGVSAIPGGTSFVTGKFGGSAGENATFGAGEGNETVLTSEGNYDIFIAKYNPDGTLAQAKSAGGTDEDEGNGVAALPDEWVAITGFFRATATFGAGNQNETQLTSSGTDDFFIAQYLYNDPPGAPTALQQKDLNDTIVPNDGTASTHGVKLSATSGDDPENYDVRLEFEVRLDCESYTDIPTHTSGLVPECSANTIVASLANNDYKWRVRTRDIFGKVSSWVEFGGGATPNFTINDASGFSRTQERFRWYDADDTALAGENAMATAAPGAQLHLRLQANVIGNTWYLGEQYVTLERANDVNFTVNLTEVTAFWDDADNAADNTISSAVLTGTTVSQTYAESNPNDPDNQSNVAAGGYAEWDFAITAPVTPLYYYYRFKVSDVIDSVSSGAAAAIRVEPPITPAPSSSYWVDTSALTGLEDNDSNEVIGPNDGTQGTVFEQKWGANVDFWDHTYDDPVGMTDMTHPIVNASLTVYRMVSVGIAGDTYYFRMCVDGGSTWEDIFVTTTNVTYDPSWSWNIFYYIFSWDNVTDFSTRIIKTIKDGGDDTVTWDIDAMELTVDYDELRVVVVLSGQTPNFGGSPIITGVPNDIDEAAGSYTVSLYIVDQGNNARTEISTGSVEIWTPENQSVGITETWSGGCASFTVENISSFSGNYVIPLSNYPNCPSDTFIITSLDPPTNFRCTNSTSTTITWAWDNTSDEEGYQILDNTSGTVVIDDIAPGATFTMETGLAENTLCSRQVRAFSNGKTVFSDNSNLISASTLLEDPLNAEFDVTAISPISVCMSVVAPPNPASGLTGSSFESDNGVFSWGDPIYDQLGDGVDTSRNSPVSVVSIKDAIAFSAGGYHSLALLSNGSVLAWGLNLNGRLGDGTTTQRSTPVLTVGITDAIAVSAGAFHSLAVLDNGSVLAWGYNGNGRLGDGTQTQRSTPILTSGITNAIGVSAGGSHSLAVLSNGSVLAWGYNSDGQLGDGTVTQRLTPVLVSGITNAIEVSAGGSHSLAVLSNGSVLAWGSNTNGRLGDGTTTQRETPVLTSGITNAIAVSAGYSHSHAVLSNGSVLAWGDNFNGRLGDGTTTQRETPVLTSGIVNAIAVSAGSSHSLAVLTNGSVLAWGSNYYGLLGDGTQIQRETPILTGGITNATSVSAGTYHSLTLQSNGHVLAWGYNFNGQLGEGTPVLRLTPILTSGITNATGVSAGYFHSLAVLSNSSVLAWGCNGDCELGDGTTTKRLTPVLTSGITNAIAVSAGTYHSLAVLSNGSVLAWGGNAAGQLGDGTQAQRSTPVLTSGITNALAVSAGGLHSLAVLSNGSVLAWGSNTNGRLGDGTTTRRTTPVLTSGITNAIGVSAGYSHSLAVLSNGSVLAWGRNSNGQLGDGTVTQRETPVLVTGITNALAVSAGDSHSLAVLSNGSVLGWGSNSNGRLGDGTQTMRLTPVLTTGITNALGVSAGRYHSHALLSNGSVLAWGSNLNGQLGDGTTTQRLTPVLTSGIANAISVSGGNYYSLAVATFSSGWLDGQYEYTKSDLVPSTLYSFRVRLRNADGTPSGYTVTKNVTTPCALPGDIWFSHVNQSSITAHWGSSGNPIWTTYHLEISLDNSAFGPVFSVENGFEYINSGLTVGTTYYYRICAENVEGSFTAWVYSSESTLGPEPVVTITSPVWTETYEAFIPLDIGGTASDDVGVTSVTWENDRGGSGTCTGTTNWSKSGITLYSGVNVITITAYDADTNNGTDTLTVTYTPDTEDPVITITSPTSDPTYETSSSPLNIGGTASDNIGVTSVTWSNDRGGSGTCTGTTSWSQTGITLYTGVNVISVNAYDATNNNASDIITVTYTSSLSPPANFRCEDCSSTTLTWAWDDVASEEGYQILDNVSGLLMVDDIGADNTSTIETGLSENTYYVRTARAFNNSKTTFSDNSTSDAAYTLCEPPQDAELAILSYDNDSIWCLQLTCPNFSMGCSAAYFQCTRGGGSDSGWLDSGSLYNASHIDHIDNGLSPNVTYGYQARYRNGDGILTAYNTPVEVCTLANIPLMENNNTTFPGETGTSITVNVRLSGNPDGTAMELFFTTDPVGTWTSCGSMTSGYQWEVTGLNTGTSYWFRAHAKNHAGIYSSNCSNTVWSTLSGAPPPENIYVSNSGDNANDGLTWGTAVKTIQRALDLGA
ncbi:MAG: RCC1 domain-containing protein, partial [Planctomycetota bacterium]